MSLKSKICGVTDPKTLNYIVEHKNSPQFVGFIVNYPKSKRYVDKYKLKELLKIKKRKSLYVAVLVNPDKNILEEIKDLPFDYYQLYNCSVDKTRSIKNIYKKKIITALTIETSDDIRNYKTYKNLADIYLFDGKGYEKSISFNHTLIENIQFNKDVMLAGDIQINDDLEKYKKIADIIDISGGLETFGLKDISKIEIFLNKMNNINNEA
ncbi:phosphoribosylanthranilate isomerase [Pelagibacterales bacterium SAG-MED13]|nr:phosphoribosylanthranilate isomerase [Pelagibacterales bacterium SAG-MED13]|tara:strand:- start:240 stop:869 length:630 start_codon:yes stop_codon:yes gene_type:complete